MLFNEKKSDSETNHRIDWTGTHMDGISCAGQLN